MNTVEIVKLQNIVNDNGEIIVVNNVKNIKRVYYMFSNRKSVRAGHAYRTTDQHIMAINGSFTLLVNNNKYLMNNKTHGLYIPHLTWHELTNFSDDSICLILSSELYDEHDYIYNHDEFLNINEVSNKWGK